MGYGKRSNKQFWRYWRLRILLVVLLFVGTTALIYYLSPKREYVARKSDSSSSPIFTRQEPTTLREVLERHYEATGGFDRQSKLHSFYMTGTLEIEGKSYPITVVKKAPNLSRTSIQFPNGDYTLGYDGKKVWSQQLRPRAPAIVNEVTGEEASVYIQDARINSRLFDYQQPDLELELLAEKQTVGENLCFVIRTKQSNGREYLHYVDSKLFIERKVSQTKNGITEEAHYTKHKQFDGISVPCEIEIYRDGVISSKLTVESIRFDGGIVSSIFSMPNPAPES